MAIRLLIAEDHEAVRLGIRGLVEATNIQIVAEAETGEQAARLARELDVDVALLDVRMPHGDGLTALGRIKQSKPELPVLMFSAYDNPMYIARAVALGGSGFLLKSTNRADFVRAIQTAAAGKEVWTNEQLRYASSALATPRYGTELEVSLTHREGEVLKRVSLGQTNREIAESLGISAEMVKEHIRAILQKIGVSDRTQAAVWAVRKALV
jgi:DNA-binding NarL/FixJ family response regulator